MDQRARLGDAGESALMWVAARRVTAPTWVAI
jgi:hypothetical protein